MTARTARTLDLIVPALVGAAVMLALLASASADTGSDPSAPTGLAAWWQDGRLAGPVAVAVYALAWCGGHLGKTRVRWLAWLRWGRVRSLLALVTASVVVLLPAAAQGTLTWGGLIGTAVAGVMALPPGGGEQRPQREQGEVSGTIDDGQVPS